MGKKSRASFGKRQKEMARQDRAREKQARRLEAKERKSNAVPGTGEEEDPDIAGIHPGPQPSPEEP